MDRFCSVVESLAALHLLRVQVCGAVAAAEPGGDHHGQDEDPPGTVETGGRGRPGQKPTFVRNTVYLWLQQNPPKHRLNPRKIDTICPHNSVHFNIKTRAWWVEALKWW